MAEVAPYVLRYWETEFPALAEGKDRGAPRLYTARDVQIIARIRQLLYDEGFTVAGAKKRLESEIAECRRSPLFTSPRLRVTWAEVERPNDVDCIATYLYQQLRPMWGEILSSATPLPVNLPPSR